MKSLCFFVILFGHLILYSESHAQTSRKIIKYRQHTSLDFSGQTVQGKIRSPDVFYIFQRKRSQGPQIVNPPDQLESLRLQTRRVVEGML